MVCCHELVLLLVCQVPLLLFYSLDLEHDLDRVFLPMLSYVLYLSLMVCFTFIARFLCLCGLLAVRRIV